MDRKDYFKRFLNHFWLRPENAILLALRSESYFRTINDINGFKNGIDVSCGDGVYSFLSFGGQLSIETDMFQSVKLGKRENDFDAFDQFDDSYKIEIVGRPERFYNYGSDWKENLIKKAQKLDFYQNLIVHDNNFDLPFSSNYFDLVYSNSAYWVGNFENHIRDLVRVTETGGHIVLQMKNSNVANNSSRYYAQFMGEKFHKIIDAGRSSTWKGLRTEEELLKFLKSIDGVKIESIEPIYGDVLGKIWDIGLRPLFNPLVKMANNIDFKERIEVKNEWCKIMFDLFEEMLANYKPKDQIIEYTYVLRKS